MIKRAHIGTWRRVFIQGIPGARYSLLYIYYELLLWILTIVSSAIILTGSVCILRQIWHLAALTREISLTFGAKLAAKRDQSYGLVMSWLHCSISFSLLWSAITCLRGARSIRGSHHNSQDKVCTSRWPIDLYKGPTFVCPGPHDFSRQAWGQV